MRQVIIYPGENGYWVAECPRLPGCISQGKTKEEAIENIKEAIEAYISALKEDDFPIPENRLEEGKVVIKPLVGLSQFEKELRGCVESSKIDPLDAKGIWEA